MPVPSNQRIEAARDAAVRGFLLLEDTPSAITAAVHALAMTIWRCYPPHLRAEAIAIAQRETQAGVEALTPSTQIAGRT